MSVRIVLADDHDMFREGLRSLLEKQPDFEIVAEARNGREAIELVARSRPNLVIMDITMPDLNGIDATRQIQSLDLGVKVIGLSMHSNRRLMYEIIRAGASGFVLKECAFAELVHAIRAVLAGDAYLSPRVTEAFLHERVRIAAASPADGNSVFANLSAREREVLQLIAEGHSTKDIAHRLYVSTKTIEAHRARMMEKLRIDSIAGLTKFAVNEGITSPDP